jgi:hypothetical protein
MNTDSYLIDLQRPIVVNDRFRQINEFAYDGSSQSVTNDFFANNGYSNAVGKRVLCKAQWLTGLERRICGAQILSKCGRKPVCSGIVSKKCKQKKEDWLKCAQGVSFVPNPNDTTGGGGTGSETAPDSGAGAGAGTGTGAGDGSGAPEKDSAETIMGINKNLLIYGGLGLLLIGGTVAVIASRKNKKSMVQSAPVRR